MVWLKQIKRKQSNSRVPQILIISFGFLLILVGKADLTAVRYMQGGVVETIAPLYSIVTVPVNSIESLFEGLQTVASLRTKANRLELENARLKKLQRITESLKVENRQLRTVLGAVIPQEWDAITARVIAVPGGNFTHSMIVEHGANNVIARGSAVVTAEGLVGYIISSGKYFSRILLLSDVNSRIPVILSDSSWPGLAVGKNGLILELDFLPSEAEPSLNETVVTSGHGGLLPAGIPVGRVSSIIKKQVLMTPAVELRKLSFVTILSRKTVPEFFVDPEQSDIFYSPLIDQKKERLFEGLNVKEILQ